MGHLLHGRDKRARRGCLGLRPGSGFTLVELLVVIAIIGILIALLLPAIQSAREAGRRAQCASQLHQVALALLNYEETNKIFPPGALADPGEDPGATLKFRPNWIILILPQMDRRDIFQSFVFNRIPRKIADPGYHVSDDQYVDVGGGVMLSNKDARSAEILSLLCPSDGKNNRIHYSGSIPGEAADWARGNVACNAGQFYCGLAETPNYANSWTNPLYRGVMAPNQFEISLAGISDGTAFTILIGEVRAGIAAQDRRGTWAMGGGGASMTGMNGGLGDDNGPNCCDPYADNIWGLNAVQDAGNATAVYADCMAGPAGGSLNRTSDEATNRSLHPNGLNVAMADGSVHFISDFIETTGAWGGIGAVWDWLITSADGRVVDGKKIGFN